MSNKVTFVLNDESKVNSYGFRVKNSGLDLTRFKGNPVMLSQHSNDVASVIGRWVNIRLQGAQLLADSEFDEEDPEALKIKSKVERGFIRGCSMGIAFNPSNLRSTDTGFYELVKSELLENSIVAVPSNANALRLFAESGLPLSESEIKLTLSKVTLKTKPQNMDLLQSLIELLGLPKESTEDAVLEAVKKLMGEQEATKTERAESLINRAMQEGKILASNKSFYLQAAIRDFANAENVIAQMPGKTSLAAMVSNKAKTSDRSTWNLDDYRQNAPHELQANPELYRRLIEEEYGK